MRRKVVIQLSAEADLDSLYEYIALDSPQNAVEFIRRIRKQCGRLSDFPERGSRRDDLRRGLRILGFERRVVIAFRILDK